jgi:hypothetical protein
MKAYGGALRDDELRRNTIADLQPYKLVNL